MLLLVQIKKSNVISMITGFLGFFVALFMIGSPFRVLGSEQQGVTETRQFSQGQQTRVRHALLLSNYIFNDYKEAVDAGGGKVINDFEYKEMLEFSNKILSLFQEMSSSSSSESILLAGKLIASIEKKEPHFAVVEKAERISDYLLERYQLKNSPSSTPRLQNGADKYQTLCASCHGGRGKGDGALSMALKPPPRNLLEDDFYDSLTPFKVYNTLLVGIPGTAMMSFKDHPSLTDQDLWDISYNQS